ncbi:AAA family ATPase [Microcoleus sp. POL10_C6]|uniref:AAA family ATPase n=1 Tax=Microcoleus sp. POL10_C6 TaxID=2818852 RepID=UPI002FD279F4
MTWNPLQLRGISFSGPYKDHAFLEFQTGLNVICGASDTGKSLIVEAIDFLLGAQDPLRHIPERDGYDRARLVLEPTDGEVFTLERSTDGGDFHKFEGDWLLGNPNVQPHILGKKHAAGNKNTLSNYLLSTIGITDQRVRTNQKGETASLSFRNLVKLVVVKESDITKRLSPFLSGQNVSKTVDYSVFKLLLTGVDDSALVGQAQIQNAQESTRQNNIAKVELINELIQELETEIHQFGINRTEAEVQLSQLKAQSEAQQEILNRSERELNDRIIRRRVLMERLEGFSTRINEIASLLSRFELLKEHYQIDIERLAAIEESGSLFVHLERTPCPLCGSLPDEQHQSVICDGDVASVVYAATAEIAKVEKLLRELDQTTEDLRDEVEELTAQRERLNPEFQILNQEIQEISSPIRDAQNIFSEIVKQSGDIQRAIDTFNRIEQLRDKRVEFLAETEKPIKVVIPPVSLSASLLDLFAQKVQHLLQSWDFPDSNRVHFSEDIKDIVIGGQPRTSSGKGLRAITHAAMTIGLMEFCKERNLSHPGFVVLDSPLLAYYKPESEEDSLQGSDLKVRFYNYLADNHGDSQITIIENEHPPDDLKNRITFTHFTKNPGSGRYGLFPHV